MIADETETAVVAQQWRRPTESGSDGFGPPVEEYGGMSEISQRVLILDFGGQYTQLIARRIRDAGVYSEILPYHASPQALAQKPAAIVLSGGPDSVADPQAPACDAGWLRAPVPILGICYGMQLMVQEAGGEVRPSSSREYGRAELQLDEEERALPLFRGWQNNETVWMSHGDSTRELPPGFRVCARSGDVVAAIGNDDSRRYGLQFHPEVHHTPQGSRLLHNFLFEICGCEATWTSRRFVEDTIGSIRSRVGNDSVLCGLSGGVDSAVTALLAHRAVGDRLACLMVDNGLLRQGERQALEAAFVERLNIPVLVVDASERFLSALKGVEDPEHKRKVIGRIFIEVFADEAKRLAMERGEEFAFLAQGTLYPDVIESVPVRGPSATIKSHHNVGGLPEVLPMALLEPLRELFKDEVRGVGAELGLDPLFINRHPFPGPGLAVRIVGEVTQERLELVRQADAIVLEEIRQSGLYGDVWQAFAVLLPVRSVGVMGDQRTYEHAIAVRVVHSVDGMTADWVRLPEAVLASIGSRIVNEVRGVNRVVYDVSSKPPSTIEWE